MKKILVTGGAGFIGSHLCKELIDQGNEVICLDNFFTGQKKNINELINYSTFELIRHDICEKLIIEVDEIYNFACPASPIHYQFNPIKTIKTSIIGGMNLLGLAKRTGAKILQASTSEIYGDPLVHPQSENYWGNVNPIGIRSCYDEGKRCLETLSFDYNRRHKVESKVIRIFNTYGPNMRVDDGRVISNFIIQALQNKNITVYGDGLQTRSFQYIDDLIEGVIRVMNTPKEFTGPINLGNPNEFKMIELAEIIIQLTNSKSKIEYLPLPKDDPKQRKPDISLAKSELDGWSPKINLEQGLLKTIKYFENQL